MNQFWHSLLRFDLSVVCCCMVDILNSFFYSNKFRWRQTKYLFWYLFFIFLNTQLNVTREGNSCFKFQTLKNRTVFVCFLFYFNFYLFFFFLYLYWQDRTKWEKPSPKATNGKQKRKYLFNIKFPIGITNAKGFFLFSFFVSSYVMQLTRVRIMSWNLDFDSFALCLWLDVWTIKIKIKISIYMFPIVRYKLYIFNIQYKNTQLSKSHWLKHAMQCNQPTKWE